MITVEVKGHGQFDVEEGSSLLDLAKEVSPENYRQFLGAVSSQQIKPLSDPIKKPMKLAFLDISSPWGYRIYTKTVSAIFVMACESLYPGRKVKLNHFLGSGLYAELDKDVVIGHRMIEKITDRMREIVEADIPIVKERWETEKIIAHAKMKGYDETAELYETSGRTWDAVHIIGDFVTAFQGNLAASTGFVRDFALRYYYPGVLIVLPSSKNNYDTNNYKEQKKLAKVFSESQEWAEILDLAYLGSLNRKIQEGKVRDVIQVAEALQEKKIGRIADAIKADDDIRLVLISGPSSSGKTSFAYRLSIALKVNGLNPVSISMDDYFVDREDTPKDEEGNYDFECIEAINLELLNNDIIKLMEGEEIELPKFDFKQGKRVRSGRKIQVGRGRPIIVEGLHALNPRLSLDVPDKNKYKIYISALTQLNLDPHNRIPTTDTRLIRRLVRDNQFRGLDPNTTFALWAGVRKGEERYIFPYQELADVMFDSALVYEFSVLKKYALPLLGQVEPSSPFYIEATKLMDFLSYFNDIDQEELIPINSILKEFMGGSIFDVH